MVSTTSNVLATIGTVCWCIQLIPQLVYNYRRKNTEGFPELMALLWFMCAPFFAVFVVVEDASIPIMIQPHLFGFFCWLLYIQIMYYPPVQRPKKQIIIRAGSLAVFMMALEVGCIIPLRKLYMQGTTFPALIFGIIASIFLAIGLIPPYFELAKRDGRVVGINFLFLLVDYSGAVFSLASLAVDTEKLDIMGLVLYVICAALESGIFVSQFVWLVRFRLFKGIEDDHIEDLENGSTSIRTSSEDTDYELETEITKTDNGTEKTGDKEKEISPADAVDFDHLSPINTVLN